MSRNNLSNNITRHTCARIGDTCGNVVFLSPYIHLHNNIIYLRGDNRGDNRGDMEGTKSKMSPAEALS
jgi:hypothetical protein